MISRSTPFIAVLLTFLLLPLSLNQAQAEESSTTKTLSESLSDYLASGLTSTLRSETPATHTDPDEFQTFYWPWCRDSGGTKTLDDPADLYGCKTTSCPCTGYESPVDMRNYLDNTLGAVSVNSSGHYEVGGKERRFFGMYFANHAANYPDKDNATYTWNAEMIAKRFAVTGLNMHRMLDLDNENFLGDTLDTIDSDKLSDFVSNIDMLGNEGIAVDLALHSNRGDGGQGLIESSTTATSSSDGDGILSAEELRCSADSTDYHVSKSLVYVSDDLREVEKKFARDLLQASSDNGTTLANHDALALIEITNENPLASMYASGYLHGVEGAACEEADHQYFTQYWADELTRDFQDWLEDKYSGDFSMLEAAWSSTSGSDLLNGHNGDFEDWNPDESNLSTSTGSKDTIFKRVFLNWNRSYSSKNGVTVSSITGQGQTYTADDGTSKRYLKLSLGQSGTLENWSAENFKLRFEGFATSASSSATEIDQYCCNGLDDDSDGLTDGDDYDCNGQRGFAVESDCANGVDDDSDGATDSVDTNCQTSASAPDCHDGSLEITHFNKDMDADGLVSSSEGLSFEKDQPYTARITYKIDSFTDSSGGSDCSPRLQFFLLDGDTSNNISGDSITLSTDNSDWQTTETCLMPNADDMPDAFEIDNTIENGQLQFALGNDCASVVLLIDEIQVLSQGIGLTNDESSFESVGISSYDNRLCMGTQRWDDTVTFFKEKAEAHYEAMRQEIRDNSFAGPIQNTNCNYSMPDTASRDKTLDTTAYSGTDSIFTDSHVYWDSGTTNDNGDLFCYHGTPYLSAYETTEQLTSESEINGTYNNDNLPPIRGAHSALSGMPYMITETATYIGNPYREEGALLMAIQSSFQGWDGVILNGYNYWDYSLDSVLNQYKMPRIQYSLENPLFSALLPAASLIIRNDYAKTAASTITLSYSDDDILDHFSGSYALGNAAVEGMPTAIALTHPVRRTVGGTASTDAATDYATEISEFETQAASLSLSSSDGVVNWDFGNHYFTLNAGKAQGFVGFIQGKTLATDELAVYLENPDYGIVMATALDDKGFDETENLLVTTTAYGRNDGQYDLVTEVDGQLCYPTGGLQLGPGDSYDESTGEGYSQTIFPQGVIALDLGASASAVSVTAVDALGRTAAVTAQSTSENGRYIFEFNRDTYDFLSTMFSSDGSLDKTLWFNVAVTRDTDTDGDGVYDGSDNCDLLTNADQADADTDGIGDICDDSDSDGSMDNADCDDTNALVYPGATESCNSTDDDCNGIIDDISRFSGTTYYTGTTFYRDRDGDGYGKKREFVVSCSAPTGYVRRHPSGFDCNDFRARINPGAKEICADVIDNDCDGAIDETDCTKMTVR